MKNYCVILLVGVFFSLNVMCMKQDYKELIREAMKKDGIKMSQQQKARLGVTEESIAGSDISGHVGRNAIFENELLMQEALNKREKK